MEIGDVVIYTDAKGVPHKALVTADWSYSSQRSLNLVYVSSDETQSDSYGRQIARDTSVPHKDHQAAPGRFWVEL